MPFWVTAPEATSYCSVPPEPMAMPVDASGIFTHRVPPLMAVGPVKVFWALSVSVPSPVFVRPPGPLRTPENVVLLFVAADCEQYAPRPPCREGTALPPPTQGRNVRRAQGSGESQAVGRVQHQRRILQGICLAQFQNARIDGRVAGVSIVAAQDESAASDGQIDDPAASVLDRSGEGRRAGAAERERRTARTAGDDLACGGRRPDRPPASQPSG